MSIMAPIRGGIRGVIRGGAQSSGGTPLLLDTLPVAADLAYSERRLGRIYLGPVNQVRRTSDSSQTDITTVGEHYDDVAALAFTGANGGFVAARYDQSGNARHATQGTAAAQMRIINAGVLDTLNGRAATTGTAGSQSYSIATLGVPAGFTLIGVCQTTFDSSFAGDLGTGNTQFRVNTASMDRMSFRANPDETLSSLGIGSTAASVFAFTRIGNDTALYINGVLVGTGTAVNGFVINVIGALDGVSVTGNIRGPFPELVFLQTGLTLAQMRPAMRNMGAYYGITVA